MNLIKWINRIVAIFFVTTLFSIKYACANPTDLYTEISINSLINTVTVSGNAGAENAGKEAVLVVLKASDSPYTLNDIDISNPMDKVFTIRQTTVGNDGKFAFSFYWDTTFSGGEYQFKVAVKGVDLDEELRTSKYLFVSQAEIDAALESVNSAEAADMETALAKYELHLDIQNGDYIQVKNDVHNILVDLRNNIANKKFENTVELSRYFSKSIFYALIQNGKLTVDKLESYGEIEGIYFSEDYNEVKSDAVLNLIRNKPSKIMSAADVQHLLNESVALALLNKAGRESIIEVMGLYESVLGLDKLNEYSKYTSFSKENKLLFNIALSGKGFKDIEEFRDAFKGKMASFSTGSGDGGGNGGRTGNTSSKAAASLTMPILSAETSASIKDLYVKKFVDLEDFSWAIDAINTFTDKGYVEGIGNNLFVPSENVTREQFIKILISSLDLTDNEAACDFNDCSESDWYYKYVASAKKLGIIEGINNEIFGAGLFITRQDMSVIIDRVIKIKNITLREIDNYDEFADYDKIAEYARGSVARLKKAGIINGLENNMFGALKLSSRAEATVVLYRLWDLLQTTE